MVVGYLFLLDILHSWQHRSLTSKTLDVSYNRVHWSLFASGPACRCPRFHTDLQALSESERNSELGLSGLDAASIESVNLHLSALPRLQLAVKVEADEGDSDIQQGDVGHCRVRYMQPFTLQLVAAIFHVFFLTTCWNSTAHQLSSSCSVIAAIGGLSYVRVRSC